ncbi:MAG: zf-HC2 domain-containing protein [Oscillospiraceae bacterium]
MKTPPCWTPLDGETTPEETAEVRAHLADCPDCRAYVADAMTLRAAFPTEEDAELPADFAKNVMAAVVKTPQPRPKKQPWGKVAAAAACVAVLLWCKSLCRRWCVRQRYVLRQ